MQFKALTLLALATALPTVLGQSCNSGIDTSVGASCNTVGNTACAETNTAVVSKVLMISKLHSRMSGHREMLTILCR